MRDCGKEKRQTRWFYHLRCDRDTPETWSHGKFSSGGTRLHPFDFFWANLPNDIPKQVANYDDMIPQLWEALALEE